MTFLPAGRAALFAIRHDESGWTDDYPSLFRVL